MNRATPGIKDPIKLDEILEALLGKYDSFSARLKHIEFSLNDPYPRISVRGSYISFRDGLPTIEDFVTLVHRRITSFCLPRNELKATHDLAVTKSADEAAELWTAAVTRASSRYIKAKKGSHRSGEATEIILFILLEWVLKAPQIVSKMTTCYNALLKFALEESNNSELIASIPAIPVYLEVGACTPTMMSFMELGISRYTAAKLHLRPARSDLSASSARDWLRRQDLDSLDIPRASANEVRRLGLGS